MASLVKTPHIRRFALSVQYHGGHFLGFSYQPKQEDCRTDQVDHRGLLSVEGKLWRAIERGGHPVTNIQVSSRTDRGVHALSNTFHLDIEDPEAKWKPRELLDSLNFHLSRLDYDPQTPHTSFQPNTMRLLHCRIPPASMYDSLNDQEIDWNARFSATQRTYVYRILSIGQSGTVFEHDRSYIIHDFLQAHLMREASSYLTGTQDYSAFRNSGCQRDSPVTTISSIRVDSEAYQTASLPGTPATGQLVTITVKGSAFLYRQVRNFVGCLVEVGLNRIKPNEVRDLVLSKDRSQAPSTAPAHGLYLVSVQHGKFYI